MLTLKNYKFRWEELISLTRQRKGLLNGAEQVHKFIRDASETNDRMNEKVCVLLCVFVHENIKFYCVI